MSCSTVMILKLCQADLLSTVVRNTGLLNELLKIHMGQYFRKCDLHSVSDHCISSVHLSPRAFDCISVGGGTNA